MRVRCMALGRGPRAAIAGALWHYRPGRTADARLRPERVLRSGVGDHAPLVSPGAGAAALALLVAAVTTLPPGAIVRAAEPPRCRRCHALLLSGFTYSAALTVHSTHTGRTATVGGDYCSSECLALAARSLAAEAAWQPAPITDDCHAFGA